MFRAKAIQYLLKGRCKMKTVLVPGAPWPDPERVVEKKPKQHSWRHIKIDNNNFDYFAETHNELLQPKKGQGNPNAAKNFEKFNLRSS
jgi:hypothetical protein